MNCLLVFVYLMESGYISEN